MKINALIIDDEQNGIENLSILLKQYCPTVDVIGVANDLLQAKRLIEQTKPHLLFLDIQIGSNTIFEVLPEINLKNLEIVFVTAHHDYALKAFQFAAIDYLLKPIDIQKLIQAVKRVEGNLKSRNFSLHFNEFSQALTKGNPIKIALPTGDGFTFLQISNIVFCEAKGSYTEVHLQSGSKKLVSKNLKYFEKILDKHSFVRVHNSFLVNIMFVVEYVKKDGGFLILESNIQVPVSRSRKDEVLSILLKSI